MTSGKVPEGGYMEKDDEGGGYMDKVMKINGVTLKKEYVRS